MISQRQRIASYTILVLFAIVALYPIINIVVLSLTAPEGGGYVLSNYTAAWEIGRFSTYLRMSLLVSSFVVVCSLVLSSLAGYAFGCMRFRGVTALFYLCLIGIMVPMEAVALPLYFDLRSVGLTDTFWSVSLPQVAQISAFGTFWMRAYFLSSPPALREAARIDGANHWQILWRILIPVARPNLIALAVLGFMWSWNEFFIPLVMVTSESLRTAPLGLAFFQGKYTTAVGPLAAGAVIVALPVVVVYLALQRHFIRGIIEGAIKG